MKKEISDFPGYYAHDNGVISNGLFKLRQRTNNHGYARVGLRKNGKTTEMLVHRLVAKTFLPNDNNKSVVNHKNLDKSDNSVNNLEWVTHKENVQHYHKHKH